MATIRSREISACLVLQAQSQLKALYKDNMDTIIGNCDSSLFLGGKEETTLEGYGNDNPGAKSQGIKQLMAGGGIALVGATLIPLLSGLFG